MAWTEQGEALGGLLKKAGSYLRKLVIQPAFRTLWRNIALVTQLTRRTS